MGPKFALAPRIDEKLIYQVRKEVAACAYRLRWRDCLSNVNSCMTQVQHFRLQGAPIDSPFAKPLPDSNFTTEDKLKELNNFIVELLRKSNVKFNLSRQQVAGFKSLLERKEDLSISVSDKGGEFVVLENDVQRQLTENHLSHSLGVYKPVPPTCKPLGHIRVVANPTNISYRRQIKSLTDRLQSKANTLWKKICINHNLDKNVEVALLSSNTQLPIMYVLLKTHKFSVSEISSSEDFIDTCKVRPIVSCCNGPSEKLAWLCTYMLTPLLPTHTFSPIRYPSTSGKLILSFTRGNSRIEIL